MTATYRRASIPPPRMANRSKGSVALRRFAEAVLIYVLDTWILMLVLGCLHSWQLRIPAVPFWPMLGLVYLLGTLVGFVTWSVVRSAQVWLKDDSR